MIADKKKKIILSDTAFETIRRDTLTYGEKSLEAGGLLLGFEHENHAVVIHALPTNPDNSIGHGHIIINADQSILVNVLFHYKHPRMIILGSAHSHHRIGMPYLSSVDKEGMKSALESLEQFVPHLSEHYYSVLTTIDENTEVQFHGFVGSLKEGNLNVSQAEIAVVSDDAPEVTEHLGQPVKKELTFCEEGSIKDGIRVVLGEYCKEHLRELEADENGNGNFRYKLKAKKRPPIDVCIKKIADGYHVEILVEQIRSSLLQLSSSKEFFKIIKSLEHLFDEREVQNGSDESEKQ